MNFIAKYTNRAVPLIRLTFSLAFLVLASGASSAKAEAESTRPHHHGHHYYFGYWHGAPYGWGYFNYLNWPAGYWNNIGWTGLSYFTHFYNLPQFQTFGVISYSASKNTWGVSWGQPSVFHASGTANYHCGMGDCQPVVWTQGGCAAIATSTQSKVITWGVAHTRALAELAAQNSCAQASGQATDCLSQAYTCTF